MLRKLVRPTYMSFGNMFLIFDHGGYIQLHQYETTLFL